MAKKKKPTRAKRPPKPPAAPAPPPILLPDEDVIERVVGLLVNFRSKAEVFNVVANHQGFKLSHDEARAVIAEAARRIALAAQVDFDAEVGATNTRLGDLYEKCLAASDLKAALATIRERNKLLALYPREIKPGAGSTGSSEAADELAFVREILAPLVGSEDNEPVSEIARRVVALFVEDPGNGNSDA